MAIHTPLTSRPIDLLYFIFFVVHIPATLLIDFQAVWPKHLIPESLQLLPPWYVGMSGDFLVGGSMGILGNGSGLAWFKSFLYLEAVFQLPVFVIGAYGLWKDSRGIYGLLVLYGASTCTTTYACIAAILEAPTTSAATIAQNVVSVTPAQRSMLLFSHAPFFVIPLFLAVDMAVRLQKLAAVGIRALESSKRR
ncbi:transmembrane protein 6/97 [Lactarius hengduanensis]|nr:transmembrane protein 6/97 [Lactarius hengduanensis]KAH9028409.1 transmembrane protein 6/97 [Lactarius hengduanensis]